MTTPKEELERAFELESASNHVPLWELHLHTWGALANREFVGRPEFDSLTPTEQHRTISVNAEIIAEVALDEGFAGVTIPDLPWDCMYTLPMPARLDLARQLVDAADDRFMVIASCGGYLGIPSPADYLEFSYLLFDDPDAVDDLAAQRLQQGLTHAAMLRDAGVEAVYSGADLADNRGPWYPPALMDRFVFPYMQRWAAGIRAMGLTPIAHTDGDVTTLLARIADCGINVIQAIDPVAGMSIEGARAAGGERLCLCGNVDCGLLLTGPPQAVYDQTRSIIEAGTREGGFVLGASNAVVVETPTENYRAMLQAFRDAGQLHDQT